NSPWSSCARASTMRMPRLSDSFPEAIPLSSTRHQISAPRRAAATQMRAGGFMHECLAALVTSSETIIPRPALLRIDLKFSLQQFKPDPPRLKPREAYRLAELTQIHVAVDACAKFWNPQRAMYTREVFEPTLDCGDGVLDLVGLRERSGPRYCPNSRCEFTAYSMRQFLQQESHGTLRISALPKIADQSRRSLLHTLGRSMRTNSLRILHKAALTFDKADLPCRQHQMGRC